jgi:hypothetical protein
MHHEGFVSSDDNGILAKPDQARAFLLEAHDLQPVN